MSFNILKFGKSQREEVDIAHNNKSEEIIMSDASFNKIRDILYKNCGIYYGENKKNILERQLIKRLSFNNINSFEKYIILINEPSGKQEIDELNKSITLNETTFFRAIEQFDVFEKIIVPEIIKNRDKNVKPIFRIWVASASTGEEAYSIAMIVNEKLSEKYPNIQFQILGSDISNQVLEEARKGIFEEGSLKNTPSEYIDKYFTEAGNSYSINEKIKKMVKFVKLNLLDSKEMQTITGCDIVFCCNILVDYDLQTKQQVLTHLFNSLNSGGYLFIGYTESLYGIPNDFKLVHLPKAMAYKKPL
jgi:chemotaxis protein methyltransferase CheR